jgi:flagellar biogenesis protein FliO
MGSLLSASTSLGDYLSGLLQALAALGVVAAFAFLVLRFGALRSALGPRGQRLSIEDRLRLDARSQLLIVRVEQRRLLIATHTEGPARLLAELGEPGEPVAEPGGAWPAVTQPGAQAPTFARPASAEPRAPEPAHAERGTAVEP